MTEKEQLHLIAENKKLREETVQESFKQNVRMLAIEKAVNISGGYGADRIIEDAEKIYQWLIKDL